MIERANKGLHDYLFKLLGDYFTEKKPNSILDIAAGSGAWLKRFDWIENTNKAGIDLDTAQFALPGVHCRKVDIDRYNGERFGTFELITAIELIEHLQNPGKLFEIFRNNLSRDGVVLISTPNIHSLPARLRFLITGRLTHFDNKSDATHIYPVYIENFKKLVVNYGFEILQTYSYPQKGYSNYKGLSLLASRFSKVLAKDNLPGDNIIFLLKRRIIHFKYEAVDYRG